MDLLYASELDLVSGLHVAPGVIAAAAELTAA